MWPVSFKNKFSHGAQQDRLRHFSCNQNGKKINCDLNMVGSTLISANAGQPHYVFAVRSKVDKCACAKCWLAGYATNSESPCVGKAFAYALEKFKSKGLAAQHW